MRMQRINVAVKRLGDHLERTMSIIILKPGEVSLEELEAADPDLASVKS